MDVRTTLADVEQALQAEMERVKNEIASWRKDPCALLMHIVRFIDQHFVLGTIHGGPGDLVQLRDDLIFRMGLNPALALLVPQIADEPGFPAWPADAETARMSGTILHHFGRIRLFQRCIRLAHSGAFSVSRSGQRVEFKRADALSGVEAFERLDEAWLKEKLTSPRLDLPEEIRSEMRALVYVWRKHYIGYDTNPAIDVHFARFAAEVFDRQRAQHGIHPSFRFGSITGKEISVVSALLLGLYMKHIVFCLEYKSKYPEQLFDNVLTIWTERGELTDSISSFANEIQDARPPGVDAVFRLDRKNVHRCLTALSLSKSNVAHHAKRFVTPIPPLIEVRRNFWIRPVSSILEGPLAFGMHEFRRKFPEAWDKNIRKREQWFRNDLYALFAGDRFRCLSREAQLFDGGRTITDVDAAIVDVMTGRLALFELKWQEPIAMDENERRSRGHRLRQEVFKWADVILNLVKEKGEDNLKSQLGLERSQTSGGATLFVISRHHARFSGIEINHPNVAVSSWRQFQRARFEMGPRDDTFLEIFERLKKEERRPLESGTAIADFSVAGFEVSAEHFFVQQQPS